MYLKEIMDYKQTEVAEFKKIHSFREFERKITQHSQGYFETSLRKSRPAIIAEIKKASPSQGLISREFNPIEIAKIYTEIGINAISVLTDKKFFGGDIRYLEQIREITSLPLLRKDFILDEIQILEAVACGANAILLIVAALPPKRLEQLRKFSEELGLSVLVEIHDEEELRIALDVGAGIIGINNRNLKTFQIDLNNSVHLLPLIPSSILKISESGIEKREDVEKILPQGADAFLIGTSFMKAQDKHKFLKELLG